MSSFNSGNEPELGGGLANGEDKSKEKESIYEMYARDDHDSSEEDEPTENEETEDEGDIECNQYETLEGDGSEDEFQAFEGAEAEVYNNRTDVLLGEALTRSDELQDPQYSGGGGMGIPEDDEVRDVLTRKGRSNDIPEILPAERISPLSEEKVANIKNIMAGINLKLKIGSSIELMAQNLSRSRVGDEHNGSTVPPVKK